MTHSPDQAARLATGHDHATGFPIFAADAVLEVRTPAPETWTGAEWNAHVIAATSNRNGVPERLITCPTPVCTTTCPARQDEVTTSPAVPDTTDHPVYRVTMPSGFPWADQKLTIPAPASADDIAMVVHTELTEVGYASGTLDVTVELSTGVVQVSYQGWTSTDGTIAGPGVGEQPATSDTTPDLTAAVGLLRKLFAAGWKADHQWRRADGGGTYGLIHPSGREIEARVYPDQTCLTLTGLTLDQAVGAVTGAGLAPDVEVEPADRLAAELDRIADAIRTRRLPFGNHVSLGLGVLDSRADLVRLAAHLGSEIDEHGGSSRDVPITEHRIQFSDERWGPGLLIRAQIQPDGQSEVERLRADNARLAAALEAAQGGPR